MNYHYRLQHCLNLMYSNCFRFIRMSPERLEHLVQLVGPYITKKDCRSRKTISVKERLVLTLRYLASGDSQQSQSFSFRVGRSTVSNIIRETCDGIWKALSPMYLKPPSTTEDWLKIAQEFEEEWNFPHCIGAIDGKHVAMECPPNAGSGFFNYKKFHSIVLLAVCDARYCFTFVDIGAHGANNDAAVLAESEFGKIFSENPETLQLPKPNLVGNATLPYVLVGDDIFPLKPWLMKPFPGNGLQEPQRIFNYRLSRARRTIENSFGILSAKWRILRRPIKAGVSQVEKIISGVICLHNYLRLTDNAGYLPTGFVDCENSAGEIIPGDWRSIVRGDDGLSNLKQVGGNRHSFNAGQDRDKFMTYLNSPQGQVPWQLSHVRSCGLKN